MKELIHIRNAEGDVLSAEEKENLLLARLAEIPSLIVALSGGADSAYLAWAAHEALGARALSITALSPSYSAHDRAIVEDFVSKLGVRHEFIETHELDNPAYRANAADRCYFCKDELFSALDELAHARGFAAVAYGVNADDTLDFRPGHRAATEHQVLAPLLDAGLRKAEIRLLSHLGPPRLGLPRFALAVRHGSDARASWTRRTRRSSLARAWIPPVSRAAPRQARARGNIARRNAARTRARDGRHHGGPAENGRLHLCCPGP